MTDRQNGELRGVFFHLCRNALFNTLSLTGEAFAGAFATVGRFQDAEAKTEPKAKAQTREKIRPRLFIHGLRSPYAD